MFKIVKIINSGSNTPELERVKCYEDTEAPAGSCLVWIPSIKKVAIGDICDVPYCVLAADVKKGDVQVLGYRVTPDVIMETPIYGDPSVVTAGDVVATYIDIENGICGVSNDTYSGCATIYDMCDAKKSGDKVLVYFK